MAQQELLARVADALNALGIEFMLTGSLASSAQGEPRSTHDIDLVVALDLAAAESLLSAFAADQFYWSKSTVEQAVRTCGMFNLLEIATGEKADFWLLTDSPFDRSRFARRRQLMLGQRTAWVSSPEDTIVMKLKRSEMSGGSEKQFRDALAVYELQFGRLDLGYIERWVETLGLRESWRRMVQAAKPIHLPEPGDE